jgi:cytochrome c551/c552
MPDSPPEEKDPVVGQSLSLPLMVGSLLLVATLIWALYDETYGLRPWKNYQERFVKLYSAYLLGLKPKQAAAEKAVRAASEFQKLAAEIKAAEDAAIPRVRQIDEQIALVDQRIATLSDVFQTARGEITALTYEMETAGSPSAKNKLQQKVAEVEKGPFQFALPAAGSQTDRVSFDYAQLENEYNHHKDLKAQLLSQRAEITRHAAQLRQQQDEYFRDHFTGLAEFQIDGLLRKMQNFVVEVKQINVADAGLVDRCESCHVGIREPVVLTAKDMGGERAFSSHPRPELLQAHDPDRFGCSPCHGGNGRATTSVQKAHGRYEHWLWPLYSKENVEAGCDQCHAADFVLAGAETLSSGKDLFRHRGCIACHRYEGFENEPEQLLALNQSILQLEQQRQTDQRESTRSIEQGDRASDQSEAERLYARAENLRVSMGGVDAQIEELGKQSKSLIMEMKKVGPSLKEVKAKLQKDWIPVWIKDPLAFRPSTRMPRFRLDEQERRAIAAFIWQSGIQGSIPAQQPGDPVQGKELFETRGCMGCHAVGEGKEAVGGTFAANLSRVGEKANYDYLVRFIRNPRERLLPYCPQEKRDIGPLDYQRKGLAYQADLDHTQCPNDGHELQVQQMTVMPTLRLSVDESRHIASYLMTLKRGDAVYPRADYLDDVNLKAPGRLLVQHYGCAGCHEIAGLEDEGRIGTELTQEGSKPIDRFDFALLTSEAKSRDWYDHKGFFDRKLTDPAVFDKGKEKAPLDRLRMPDPHLDRQQINSLTTFLLGSVDRQLPEEYIYRPADARRDIQDGWWIVKKYNCVGCHQIAVGQKSVLMTLERYKSPDWKEQLPPILIGEGARTNSTWLLDFLDNPALSKVDTDRNGVRPYLKARMPTFFLSPQERRKLVRFFSALSSQPIPYVPSKLEPLTDSERQLARALFTSQAAPCLKCHATGDPAHDRYVTAPNFLLAAQRLKPGWTKRWMLDPSMISPGTAMPSGLFKLAGSRWIFSGPTPDSFKEYNKDHADLLVRYMFEITPEEQRRLVGNRVTSNVPLPGRNTPSTVDAASGEQLKSDRQKRVSGQNH